MPPRTFDPTTWARASHYDWFRRMDHPWLGLTAEVDVTDVVRRCKTSELSLFSAMLHRLSLAANSVPELRQRIRVEDGRDVVIEHERVDPAFTLAVEGGLFNYGTVELVQDVEAFAAAVAQMSAERRDDTELKPFEGRRDDVLFLTCIPWVRFSQINHPVSTAEVDSMPRIAWGRISEDGGRFHCPVNLQAHHGLVDGWHVSRFYEAMES